MQYRYWTDRNYFLNRTTMLYGKLRSICHSVDLTNRKSSPHLDFFTECLSSFFLPSSPLLFWMIFTYLNTGDVSRNEKLLTVLVVCHRSGSKRDTERHFSKVHAVRVRQSRVSSLRITLPCRKFGGNIGISCACVQASFFFLSLSNLRAKATKTKGLSVNTVPWSYAVCGRNGNPSSSDSANVLTIYRSRWA